MAIKVLLSPSEVSLAKEMSGEAITSDIPEQKGADILIYSKHGLWGGQRKEVPSDFISSFTDGRMARATSLLQGSCTFTRLICEGKFRYWPDGTVHLGMTKGNKRIPSRFTRKYIHGMLNDVEFVKGIMIRWTDDIADTAEYIRSVIRFLEGTRHTGLFARPSAKGAWGVPTAKDTHLWLLQSFPGIGPTIADHIIERFGGDMPLRWTCTQEELESVPGLSKARAKVMWEALSARGTLPVGTDSTDTSTIGKLRSLIGK